MAETIFPKPLDQEVASINAHLESIPKSKSFTQTTDTSGNINFQHFTQEINKDNIISILVTSPNSVTADLYTYNNVLFAYLHTHYDQTAKTASQSVTFTVWYKGMSV